MVHGSLFTKALFKFGFPLILFALVYLQLRNFQQFKDILPNLSKIKIPLS